MRSLSKGEEGDISFKMAMEHKFKDADILGFHSIP